MVDVLIDAIFNNTYCANLNTTSALSSENSTVDEEAMVSQQRMRFEIATGVVAVLGAAGNLLLLYIFLFNRTKVSTYLICLAAVDLIFCLVYLQCFSIVRLAIELQNRELYAFMTDYMAETYVVGKIVPLFIPYLLIAASAEKLSWLEKVNNMKKNRRNTRHVVICGAIFVGLSFVRLPLWTMYAVISNEVPGTKLGLDRYLTQRPMASNGCLQNYDYAFNIVHIFCSFFVLVLLNFLIIHRLRKSHSNARRNSSCPSVLLSTAKSHYAVVEARREQKRLQAAVKTTVVVLSSYIVCNVINFFLMLAEARVLSIDMSHSVYTLISDIGTFFYVLSSSIRVLIYFRYNVEIRRAILSLSCVRPFVHGRKPGNGYASPCSSEEPLPTRL